MYAVARWGSAVLLVAWVVFCLLRLAPQIEAELTELSQDAAGDAAGAYALLDVDGRDAILIGPAGRETALRAAARRIADLPGVRRTQLVLQQTPEAETPAVPRRARPLGRPLPDPAALNPPAFSRLEQPVVRAAEDASDAPSASATPDAQSVAADAGPPEPESVADTAAAAPAERPPKPAAPDEPPGRAASSDRVTVSQRGERVAVAGRLPNRARVTELVGAVQALWGTPYTEYSVEIAGAAPAPNWMPEGLELLSALKTSVSDGRIEFSSQRIGVSGDVASEGVRSWLISEAQRLLPNHAIDVDLRIADAHGQVLERRRRSLASVVDGESIDFDLGSAALTAAAERRLDDLAEMLREFVQATLEVRGHTDNSGEQAANMALSEARARAVAEYLQDRGISADRLQPVGLGAAHPVASNDTAEGRSRNRRVEFRVRTPESGAASD